MQIVEVRLTGEDDLASRLQEMRLWLNARFFECSNFTSGKRGSGTTLRADFKAPLEASQFAERFDGTIVVPEV